MTSLTSVLIVDDEEPARAILREMLGRIPGVSIVGECGDGMEAVKAAGQLKPDVVFLDIQMPRLDGFEAMELLDPAIAVVFVTAYDNYAVKAFEVRAVDYVLKPFSEARLAEALGRARERAREEGGGRTRARWRRPPALRASSSPASSSETAPTSASSPSRSSNSPRRRTTTSSSGPKERNTGSPRPSQAWPNRSIPRASRASTAPT